MLSITQQWVITKRVESGADAAAAKAKPESGSGWGARIRKLAEQGRDKLIEQGRGKLVDLSKKSSSGQTSGKRRK